MSFAGHKIWCDTCLDHPKGLLQELDAVLKHSQASHPSKTPFNFPQNLCENPLALLAGIIKFYAESLKCSNEPQYFNELFQLSYKF